MASFKYSCNCPDSIKQRTFIISSSATSAQFVQDWSKSKAGAKDGVCKHIWATRLIRKEITKDQIPKDYPVPIPDFENETTQELYQPEYGGNAFTPKQTFEIPKFKFYKGG